MATGARSRRAFAAWFVYAPLLLALGCGSSDPHAEKRQKTIECYNRYVFHQEFYAENFNKRNAETDRGRRADRLEMCRRDLDTLDPYHPLGVDPRLAGAISDWKKAGLAYLSELGQDEDPRRRQPSRAAELRQQFDAAKERVNAVVNQIAVEIGGLEKKPR